MLFMKIISPVLKTLTIFYRLYFISVFCITLIVLYPIFYLVLKKLKNFKVGFKLMRIYAKLLLVLGFIKLKIDKKETKQTTSPFIICPNHTSFIDILCIYAAFPDYFVFTGKKEIENWPLFNIFYTSGMNILVDRHSKTATVKTFRRMISEVEKGNSLVIFPEGTISKKAPLLTHFKQGAFSIATKKKIPIVPVTFLNNWERFERGNVFKTKASPGIAKMIIHQAVNTSKLSPKEILEIPTTIKEIIEDPLKPFI